MSCYACEDEGDMDVQTRATERGRRTAGERTERMGGPRVDSVPMFPEIELLSFAITWKRRTGARYSRTSGGKT